MFADLIIIDERGMPNAPFPDIVNAGKPWKKFPATPEGSHVNLDAREIYAPPGHDHMSQIVRTHEMAHAAFTSPVTEYSAEEKEQLKGIHPTAFQIAEDYLITSKLQAIGGLPVPCMCDVCKQEAEKMIGQLERAVLYDAEDPHIAARIWIGAKMCLPDLWPENGAEYDSPDPYGMEHSAIWDLDTSTPSPKHRLEIAEVLTSMIRVKPIKASIRPSRIKLRISLSENDGNPEWLVPKMEYPPLVATRTTRSYDINASDNGAIPRYMHRLPLDQRVFGARKRKEASTVLIDMSGSMGLTPTRLQKLVELFPAGTVAGYSGHFLGILAQNGRMVKEIPKVSGSNESDGPALEWLSQQRGKKFWVSDGLSTEIGDTFTARSVVECLRIVRLAGITQVKDLKNIIGDVQEPEPEK